MKLKELIKALWVMDPSGRGGWGEGGQVGGELVPMLHIAAFPGTWRRCCWRWDVCCFLTGNLILGRDRTKTQPWPLVSQKTDWVSAKWSLGTRTWEQHLLSLSPRVRCEGPSVMGTPRTEA